MKDGFLKTAAATPAIRLADCAYNAEQILGCMEEARRGGVKLLVLPELCITGYTCGDLFLQPHPAPAGAGCTGAYPDRQPRLGSDYHCRSTAPF